MAVKQDELQTKHDAMATAKEYWFQYTGFTQVDTFFSAVPRGLKSKGKTQSRARHRLESHGSRLAFISPLAIAEAFACAVKFLKVTFVTWPVTSPTPEKRKRPHRPKHAQDSRNPPPQEKSVETCSVEGRKPRRPLTGSSLFLGSQKWNNLGVKLKVRAGNEPGRHGVDADVGSNGTGRAYAYAEAPQIGASARASHLNFEITMSNHRARGTTDYIAAAVWRQFNFSSAAILQHPNFPLQHWLASIIP
ncbi:hypothetical protein B0H14DRAFT_2643173 [Mycena olivaceomarginata]|nr:hypothetical protein B0H14DRAFT_2643173 [Mycena olivaceomarginata]